MLNPYVPPDIATDREPTDASPDRPSLIRGLAFASLGYFTPFVILFPMFWVKHGWVPIDEMIIGLVAWHWPVNMIGCALLIPNLACLLLFGFAGYNRSGLLGHLGRRANGVSLGIATLIGYFAMLTVYYTVDPFRNSWGELNAIAGSGFVLAFPIGIWLYCVCFRASSSLA